MHFAVSYCFGHRRPSCPSTLPLLAAAAVAIDVVIVLSMSIYNLSFGFMFFSSFVRVFLFPISPPKTNRLTLCNVPQFLFCKL